VARVHGAYQLGKAVMDTFQALSINHKWDTTPKGFMKPTKKNTALAIQALQEAAAESGFIGLALVLDAGCSPRKLPLRKRGERHE
jgi:hypothetical protein